MSLEIDYNHTGWENVVLEENLDKLNNLFSSGKILNYSELTGGSLNKVYKLDLSSGNSLVAKISPLWYNSSLLREAWCYMKIKSITDVNVPEVISYTKSENPIFPGHEILITKYIPNRHMSNDEFLTEQTQKKMGKIIKKIHSIPMKRYGWLKDNFSGMYENWFDFLYTIDNIDLSVKSGYIEKEEKEWLLEVMSEELNFSFEPRLIHSDFRIENIIVKNSDFYVIDFQNSFSGDPDYDLGASIYRNTGLINFIHYYTKRQLNKKILKNILIYALRHNLTIIGSYVSVENLEKLKISRETFDRLKEMYMRLD